MIYHIEMISKPRFCVLTPLVQITFINTVRLIGLNVETTGIGVAVSDFKFVRASPQCVITRNDNNIDEIALELKRLITEHSGLGLIVGHPHNRGKMNKNATQVNRLTYDLDKTNILENVDYAFWEEGFTSKDSSNEDEELD